MERIRGRLYLLFTPSLCRHDPDATLRAAVRGGVDLVQWRAKARDPDGARRCLALCRELGVQMVVNDDVALAVELGAFGAHVGQDDLPAAVARASLSSHAVLGVSTHDLAQIDAAARAGADYLGFGPMFPTRTKGYRTGQPAAALGAALRATRLPVFAIGGIDADNVGELVAVGCRRVAVSSAILSAADVGAAAAALRAALGANP